MKLTDIDIKFRADQRPEVIVKFDALTQDGHNQVFLSKHHADTNSFVFRCDEGDYIAAGANLPGQGAARIRLMDGVHTGLKDLQRTNAIALNAMFPERDPVMDCMIHEGAGLSYGFVNVYSVAKYLWAANQGVALAVMEWPTGHRVFEPVQLDNTGEIVPNRAVDKAVFLVAPPASPLPEPERK